MGKIAFSAITGVILVVGAYWGASALGASDPAAPVAGFAMITAIGFLVAALTAHNRTCLTLGAAAFAAVAVALAFAADYGDGYAVIGVAAFTVLAFIVIIIVAESFKGEGIELLWIFAAYVLEVLAIGGAFAIDDAVRSAVMALAGVIALLILWGSESRLSLEKHSTRIQQGAD